MCFKTEGIMSKLRRSARLAKASAIFLPVAALLFLLAGCNKPKTYLAEEFTNYQNVHHLVAIMPFQVTIDPKKLPKDFSLEMTKEAEKDEAYNFQQQLYLRFLEKHKKGEYTVKFQDVDDTNARLGKAGINNENISNYTKTELKVILEVDALISGSIFRERPMSTGAAVVTGILFGMWGSTNKVNVALNIHDASTGDLVWKYEHKASGSVGSSPEELAKSLMKNISKKFPYRQPKA